MQEKFNPPISKRNDNEIIEIITFPERWKPRVVILAKREFETRNLDPKKIQTAQYLYKKKNRRSK